METVFIGDVHGCVDELRRLLEGIGYHEGMQLYFTGDLINKGPDSAGVLSLFKQLNARVVTGNHERAFIKYVRKGKTNKPAFEQLKTALGTQLDQWLDEIAGWPYYIETDEFILVHAGLQPGRHPSATKPRILANIRTWDGRGKALWNEEHHPPWYALYKQKKPVIYGHWATQGLRVRKHTIGLDSACVYGGALSAMLWPERRIVQVKAAQVYSKPKYAL